MSIKDGEFRFAFRQSIPVLFGYIALGLGYGLYMHNLGFSFIYPTLMALTIYGGSVEFVIANMLIQHFQPVNVLLVTLVVGFRQFLIFDHSKKGSDEISPFIDGLGKFLPPAIMGMLVVYCFRNVDFLSGTHGLPDIIATIITVLIHLWRRNMCLSLLVGTVSYILLVNFIF